MTHFYPAFFPVEIHPYLPQERLVKWVQAQGIQITAYSSFGPTSYAGISENGKQAQSLLDHADVNSIASKHGVTTGQVLLKWAVDQDIAVIPKSVNEDRMKGNFELYSFSLDDQDKKELGQLSSSQRFNDPMHYGFNLPLFD